MLRQTVARLACITHQWSDTGWPVCPGPEPASHRHVLQQQAAIHGVRSASSSSSGRKLLRLLVLSAFQPRVPCLPLQRSLVVHRVSFLKIWFPGYEDDIYLLVKLGEAAIIIFIIFALVAIIYMIVNCCVSFSGRNKWNLFYLFLFCLGSFLVCYIWSINPLFFLLVFDISGSCNFPN